MYLTVFLQQFTSLLIDVLLFIFSLTATARSSGFGQVCEVVTSIYSYKNPLPFVLFYRNFRGYDNKGTAFDFNIVKWGQIQRTQIMKAMRC